MEEVQSLTVSSKSKLTEVSATFISVADVRALVTMGELTRCKEVREKVLPKLDKEDAEACVIEGCEVQTLRKGEEHRNRL